MIKINLLYIYVKNFIVNYSLLGNDNLNLMVMWFYIIYSLIIWVMYNIVVVSLVFGL